MSDDARRPAPPSPPPDRAPARALSLAGAGRLALTLAVATAAGFAASAAGVPLAWMLGPLFATAALAIAGFDPLPVKWGRELGQVVVGLAIGVTFVEVGFTPNPLGLEGVKAAPNVLIEGHPFDGPLHEA